MYYFIINAHGKSGKTKGLWNRLKSDILSSKIEYKAFLTKSRNDAKKIAEKISDIKDDDKRIIIVGGDGTINEVINGIKDFESVCVGIIPFGSANDFANGVGISTNVTKALQNILSCKEPKEYDLGCARFGDNKKRLFAISSGIGFDAEVCKNLLHSSVKEALNKVGFGDKSYIAVTLGTLFSCKMFNIRAIYDDDHEEMYSDVVFLAAMNTPIEGGGVRMAPHASANDRVLTVSCAHTDNKAVFIPALIKLLNAKHEGIKEFIIKDFKKLEITADRPVVLHTDGEYNGETDRISYECLPKKLRLLKN